MTTSTNLAIGDIVYLADGAQLKAFARVDKLMPKTAVASLLKMSKVATPRGKWGAPGRDEYLPGEAMQVEIRLADGGSIRGGWDFKRSMGHHRFSWGKCAAGPVPRLLAGYASP